MTNTKKRNLDDLLDSRELHPAIYSSSKTLYIAGQFPQAIFEAAKTLETAIKNKSGIDRIGQRLINESFPAKLTIRAQHQDEINGAINLFRGFIGYIRNPKGHVPNYGTIDPIRALEWLSFASVLHRILDETKLADE